MMCDPETKERMSKIVHHNDPIPSQLSEMNKSRNRQQYEDTQLPTLQIPEPVLDIPDATKFIQRLPPLSVKHADEHSLQSSSDSGDSNHPFPVPLTRSTRCPSTKSYPGNFPTSDGVIHRGLCVDACVPSRAGDYVCEAFFGLLEGE